MAYILFPPPDRGGPVERQLEDLRRWAIELTERLNLSLEALEHREEAGR